MLVGVALGCQTAPPAPDRTAVTANLQNRFPPTSAAASASTPLPPGASLADGLTEDEAIAIAIWKNPAFQELLVDMGVARGDLIQAGLLPNPEIIFFAPVTDKPYKYAFELPIEAIWLRPIRVRSAKHDADRVAERLTQAGLDLMRDVRQAFADVVLARERVRIADEAVTLRGRIAELADKRLKAGDVSEQETATARIDALQAKQDAARTGFEVPIAEERLRNLLGIGDDRTSLELTPFAPSAGRQLEIDALVQEASSSRPDARAAAEAVEAAKARLELARIGWARFLGIGDATSGRATGHEFSPAARITLPIFNQNEGGIARAEAELERAVRNQQTVSNQIVLDVRRAFLQYQQASAEWDVLRSKVRPEVEGSIRRAQGAYAEGNATIFLVLESTRQLLDAYLREAQLGADLSRTWAELERSVGRRLAIPTPAPATPSPIPELPEAESEFAAERGSK